MIETHDKIEVNDFDGLHDSGDRENIPPNAMVDNLNIIFSNSEIWNREGLFTNTAGVQFGIASIMPSYVFYFDLLGLGVHPNYLYDDGAKYKDADNNFTIINNVAGPVESIFAFSRIYTLVKSNDIGGGLWVYIRFPLTSSRLAMGAKVPEAPAMTAVTSGAGKIDRGTHVFRCVFETDSGFITSPGATVAYIAAASDSVDFAVIPTGPAGTFKRHIVTTRAILNYDGDFTNREYFFIPGATINENVTTILNDISFYDADLFESADFTSDQLSSFPTSFTNQAELSGLNIYKNRLIVWISDTIWVSHPNEPEAFDAVDSAIIIDSIRYGQVVYCTELRGILYIWTNQVTLATIDNGGAPNTWEVEQIDAVNGAYKNGVASVYNRPGNIIDYLLVVNGYGIHKFTGVYADNLTSKISKIWERNISSSLIVVDPYNQRIYAFEKVLPGNQDPNFFLVGDYSNGLSPETIKWSRWKINTGNATFPNTVRWVFCEIPKEFVVGTPRLTMRFIVPDADGSSKACYLREGVLTDKGQVIDYAIEYDLGPRNDMINHWAGISLRSIGTGILSSIVYWTDKIRNTSLRNITLTATPGKSFFRGANVVSERFGLRFTMSDVTGSFKIRKLTTFWKELWTRSS